MGGASDRDSLLRTLEPVVAARGFDLEEVVVTPAGKRRVLRVVVDKDGGVDLDDIAGVSTVGRPPRSTSPTRWAPCPTCSRSPRRGSTGR